MKFTIERKALLTALGHVSRVVERRNTYPILANILLEAGGNSITLRATDLDIEATDTIAANVAEPGTTTVPAATLADIVKKYPDGSEISFEMEGGALIVKCGRSRLSLMTLDAEGFPDLTSGAFTHSYTVAPVAFAGLLKRCSFAMSTEETRYYLNGVYLHVIDGHLRGVATDGHRLAWIDMPAPEGAEGAPSVILPRKTVGEVTKILDAAKEDVLVELNESKIRFTVGDTVILSKLVEGSYPDYLRVTPQNNDKILTVPRKALAGAVDRVSTIASERGGKAVKLSLTDNQIELTVTNPDHGTADEEVPAGFDGEPMDIGYNARYLREILDVIEGDDVRFALNDGGSPSLITDPTDESIRLVLMPMRV